MFQLNSRANISWNVWYKVSYSMNWGSKLINKIGRIETSALLLHQRVHRTRYLRRELRYLVCSSSLSLFGRHHELCLLPFGLHQRRLLIYVPQQFKHAWCQCNCLVTVCSSWHDVVVYLCNSTPEESRIIGVDYVDQELSVTLRLWIAW